MDHIDQLDTEIEAWDRVILAAEKWSKQYEEDPDTHEKLIRLEPKFEKALRKYFRDLADRAVRYVDWLAYEAQLRTIQADDLEVIVNIEEGPIGQEDVLFINTAQDYIADGIALGARAGEKIYKFPIGISKTSAQVQKAASSMVAQLVGKRITEDGRIIDNPDATYRIHDKTRQDIRESVKTSLALGETREEATNRMRKTIADPRRAEMIARTEIVNSYQQGLTLYADESGAVGKVWQSLAANDICAVNGDAGVIAINKPFPSGHYAPSAHPNCRCSLVLIYKEDPRSAYIGKGNEPFRGKTTVSKTKVVIEHNNSRRTIEITPTESDFIKRSNLQFKVDPTGKRLNNSTLGMYINSSHEIYLKPPGVTTSDKLYARTFFHELGHAIDYKFTSGVKQLSQEQITSVLKDTDAVATNRMTNQKMKTPKSAISDMITSRTGRAEYKNKEGLTVKVMMPKKYLKYATSPKEIFADAYAQYRIATGTNFEKYAPSLATVFKELGL